jgi:hypothetical protein
MPRTAHPPSRRFGTAGSAVATTESDVFVAASLRRGVHGAIHPPGGAQRRGYTAARLSDRF